MYLQRRFAREEKVKEYHLGESHSHPGPSCTEALANWGLNRRKHLARTLPLL